MDEPSKRVERLFAERIARWNERTAIQIGDRRVSYHELDLRSDALARRISREGVKQGQIVAVAAGDVERFAIAALAVLKAGAAYLPIDTRYPVERVRDILLDAAPALLLARDEFAGELIPHTLPVIPDFADEPVLEMAGDVRIDVAGTADDTAYVCYTSGSTGRPKGIEVAHRGIPWLVGDREFVPFGPSDRVGQASNFAFDATTFEVWGALLNGGCLVHVPKDVLFSASALSDFLGREHISVIWLTTSLFNALAARRPDAFGAVEALIIGGEAADPVSVGRVLRSATAPRRLINAYGPTEATTFATWHEVTLADIDAGHVPIGKPIRNMRVHILDPHMKPVPKGDPGELFVAGPGVANGYLHQPGLTEERFVQAQLDAESSERMYRTGDLCRELPNGVIAYLGRIDDQVKIRGFRVEPAEVAAILRRVTGIQDVVVLARAASFGTKELVAFIRGGARSSMEQLRQEMSALVPDYMVPAVVREVEEFPLTVNGKLDRAALLKSIESGKKSGASEDEKSGIEQRIGAIWRHVLQRQDIERNDEYYALGGDSLSVMRVALEIEANFGIEMSVEDMQAPMTIAHLAARVRSLVAGMDGGAPRPADRNGAPSVFALSYPWMMGRMPDEIGQALSRGGRWHHVQVPFTYFRSGRGISIEDMALNIERQIRAVCAEGPYVVFGICFTGLLSYEVAQRLSAGGHRVAALIMVDSYPLLPQTRARRALSVALRAGRAMTHLRSMMGRISRELCSAPSVSFEEAIRQTCEQAAKEYRPRRYGGRTIFFRPTRIPRVDPFLGADIHAWRRLVTGPYTEHVIDFHDGEKVSDESAQRGYGEIAAHLKEVDLTAR